MCSHWDVQSTVMASTAEAAKRPATARVRHGRTIVSVCVYYASWMPGALRCVQSPLLTMKEFGSKSRLGRSEGEE
jgi:hypothetical protein